MFFYEGQSCPVCGKAFAETDDIVACPVCGAPHHRACWTASGHCHFEATHGTPEQWTRPKPAEETEPRNRCPNCGADNAEHAEFCSHCGRTLNAKDWSSTEQPPQYGHSAPYHEYTPFRVTFDPLGGVPRGETFDGDVTAEELAVCVGGNTSYYLPRFRRLEQGSSVQWNWAAFLITPYWLLYRKQYVAGGLTCLFFLVSNLLMNAILYMSGANGTVTYEEMAALALDAGFAPSILLLSAAALGIRLLFGLFANRLYLSSCLKKVRRVRESDPGEFLPSLRRAGGVSFLWGSIAYFGLSFVSSLLSTLLW